MITTIEIWLLGVALAMDCFSVSIATGLSIHKLLLKPMTLMAIAFGVFQGGMTLLGYIATSYLHDYIEAIDHWIAFGLLTYLGCKMIADGMKQDEQEENNNSILSPATILTMAVATSIDALAVGISFACINSNNIESILPACLIIAFCSFAFSILGLSIGIIVGKKLKIRAEILGGIVLIIIGLKIIIEHAL